MATAATHLPRKSALVLRIQKQNELSRFSGRDLASLQKYLDGDFQNFWDIRRFGRNVGTLIKCPVCSALPPKYQGGGDFIFNSYRKRAWLANHLVVAHLHDKALTHRRIEAEHLRREQASVAASKKKKGAGGPRVINLKRRAAASYG